MNMNSLKKHIIISGLLMSCLSSASAEKLPDSSAQSKFKKNASVSITMDEWNKKIAMVKNPEPGYYRATYPSLVYKKISNTVVVSKEKMHISSLAHKTTTTNPGMYRLRTPPGFYIARTTGTFPLVKNVTSVSGNRYSLQINTNEGMQTQKCDGISGGCGMWGQFVYESDPVDSALLMEFWMSGPGVAPNNCPKPYLGAGYHTCLAAYSLDYDVGSGDQIPAIPASDLDKATLIAAADKGGQDSVTLIYNGESYSISTKDSNTYISDAWNESEFNIFGPGTPSDVAFNQGALFKVITGIDYTVSGRETSTPFCMTGSLTGEGSNLVPQPPCVASGRTADTDYPNIQFTESVPAQG
ncbi:hypothetical protein [Enterobacter ludwigii]|uniref:hypothetical protein n=1 Tax=Enterobacter ludwigii TaxID=299767 RepID=UPI003F719EA2